MDTTRNSPERFTKDSAHLIAADVKSALQAVAEKYGITVAYKGGSYNDATFKPRVEFSIPIAAAAKKDKDFAMYATLVGAEPEWLGKTFASAGKTFRIVGLNTGRSKNSIELEEVSTGKSYKGTAAMVRSALSRIELTGGF